MIILRFDILASSMEQIPELEVGAVLRIHNMRVEKWNGVFDGRVYSGSSVTSVLGGVGETVVPMCHKRGPEMKWVEADDRKVEELRRWSGTFNFLHCSFPFLHQMQVVG